MAVEVAMPYGQKVAGRLVVCGVGWGPVLEAAVVPGVAAIVEAIRGLKGE